MAIQGVACASMRGSIRLAPRTTATSQTRAVRARPTIRPVIRSPTLASGLSSRLKPAAAFTRSSRMTLPSRRVVEVKSVDDPDSMAMEEPVETGGMPNAFWRLASCLCYILPLMGTLPHGVDTVHDQYPLFGILYIVFQPLLHAYHANPLTPFLVFMSLFIVVVRNMKLPHFLRFNALQSIMLDISVMLGGLIIQYLPFEIQASWVGLFLGIVTWVTGMGAVFYSVFFTVQGKYCDIPVISEAVYVQIQR
eukprot:CAMPEP_0118955878 /NCGR_PEP_ID=MMETSP1169-20130426/60652_1 /TAXON_ID=36882 /ORGANISM="Pyramimonas obovata, Strain CCMP722" /LENGTH=249 /DNA_ID=CAMNT_0006903797 /DNA_START=38 /DNA_END=787 /DNA_ORIENTATION=+